MPELIAQGDKPQHRWRRALPVGRTLVLGRAVGTWAVPWDDRISRRHVEICFRSGRLEVHVLPEARNPVFARGEEVTQLHVAPGEHFVIGGTTFTLTDEPVSVTLDAPEPVSQQSFSPQYLKQVRFRNADQRIDVLSRLPEIILGAASDTELFVRLVNVLLAGVPRASTVAVIAARREPDESGDGAAIEVLHWDRRLLTGGGFRPSEQLIRQAIDKGESVVHVWKGDAQRAGPSYTQGEDVDWAFCTPVPGDACRGWVIYVAGRLVGDHSLTSRPSDPHDLRDDLKFTELAATTLSSLREVRALERAHAGLSQFFSPLVLDVLAGEDPEVVLTPREAEVSVLFCDLRGFSRESEKSADDLLGLLNRVSKALGVMTRHILEQGGVVGDFHGDAAMGFWGWPLPQDDAAERACRAALGIHAEFERAARHRGDPLADFQIGIGIATGNAVAGKIGTTDQVKVTVFGPVANLASRLEGMTKILRAPVLLDERTAGLLRRRLPREVGRVRRLAVVRPFGMETALEVSQLLPPVDRYPQLTDEHLALYERAVDALQSGDWPSAFELLHRIPADDQVIDFLTVFIAQHNRAAPPDWDGVIPLSLK